MSEVSKSIYIYIQYFSTLVTMPTQKKESTKVSYIATDKQPVSLCEFRSAERVTCSAKAINSAGESPGTSQTGYARNTGRCACK